MTERMEIKQLILGWNMFLGFAIQFQYQIRSAEKDDFLPNM